VKISKKSLTTGGIHVNFPSVNTADGEGGGKVVFLHFRGPKKSGERGYGDA